METINCLKTRRSIRKFKDKEILDLDYQEDSGCEVDMNIVMTKAGRFIEIQGTAEKEPFAKNQMDKMIELAKKGTREIFKAQKKVLKEILDK